MGLYSETIFPWLLDRALGHPAIEARRRALVAAAAGDVLEIGFGTGATLPHYDPLLVRSLTVIEPSAGMSARAAGRIAASPIPVRAVSGGGEALPFADASFDAVVICLTLCSVEDPAAVLAEVRRVLRLGGRLHFLEHVLSPDAGIARWQRRLTPIQRVIGVGCHLDRDTPALVRAAGFALGPVELQLEPAFGAAAPLAPLAAAATGLEEAG